MSAHVSPSVSPTAPFHSPLKRRLSARRGSQTAADPFNTHAELNYHPGRSTSSRLTIVRVLPDAPAEDHSAPGSPVSRRHSLQHRRTGSGAGDTPQRLSFASSSFTRPGASASGGSGSRSTSPTLNRPRSPVANSAHRHSLPSRTRFTPDDIVRIAREACNPQYNAAHSSSASSKSGSTSNSPLASPIVGATPTSSAAPVAAVAPTSFTALPDDIWLPFVDRAAEVSTLMSTHPTARLFALLAQTLPEDNTSFTPPKVDDDASKWSFAQLDHWLRHVDREEASDRLWVRSARACVLAHSELIWERIKGALGVPPELDTDQLPPPPPEPLHMGDENAFESDPEDAYDLDVFDESEVAIEAVVVPTTPPVAAAAADSSSGLGDIGEEDEEEGGEESEGTTHPATGALAPPREEIVQGLRISTTPQPPPSGYSMSPAATFPHSPIAPRADGPSPAGSAFHLDTTPTAGPGSSVVEKGEGSTPVAVGGYAPRQRSYSSSSHGSSRSGYYDVVAERGPGNPLFPSSFARLALAPTLSANNPNLRSPNPPPMSAYGIMRTGSLSGLSSSVSASGAAIPRRGGPPSWAEGYEVGKSEYAITTASESVQGDA